MTDRSTPSDKPRHPRSAPRSRARLNSVQALYQMDLAQTDLNDVIAEFGTSRLSDVDDAERGSNEDRSIDVEFFSDILHGVVARQQEIDPMIAENLADGWRLTRIDSTLRAILRAGTFEIIARKDVPARVVIDEYLIVAHAFFDGDEPRVVNGVLDRLAHHARPAEFDNTAGL